MNRMGWVSLAALAAGCGDDASGGTGSVQIFLEAEDTIPEGLTPGDGEENIVDGWAVTYDKFVLSIGGYYAFRSSTPGDRLESPQIQVVDMTAFQEGGVVVAEWNDVEAVRWDKFGYQTPVAPADAVAGEGAMPADVEMMTTNGWTIYVEGSLTKADGESCLPTDPTDCAPNPQIHFAWGVDAGTSYDDCAPEQGDAGFAVNAGGSTQVKPTIHGDHAWFNGFPEGVELVERRVQWAANCDLDRDGEVTTDELGQVQAADVFPSPEYNLASAPGSVETALDFFVAQEHTIGHLQGEGECVWTVQ